jgi:hypothetical protein
MKDEQALRAIVDRAALIERINDYAYACDSRDWGLLASCFADDGIADYGEYGGRFEGPEAVVGLVRAALSGLDASQHLFSNHSVRIDGDTARVRSYLFAQHVLVTPRGSNTYSVGAIYHFDLVRDGATWRIKLLELMPSWSDGNPGVFAEAAARREGSTDAQTAFRRLLGVEQRRLEDPDRSGALE